MKFCHFYQKSAMWVRQNGLGNMGFGNLVLIRANTEFLIDMHRYFLMLPFTPLISIQTTNQLKKRYNLPRQCRLNDRRN